MDLQAKVKVPPWKTYSVFISSTFADMQTERDYLKTHVIPELEETLRHHRIRLELVDLRWGVDTASVQEDERETTVLKVCLEEIKRCKPFFIGLLGDRYGWVPPEDRLTAITSGEKHLFGEKQKSVTALEMEFGVMASIEQLNRSIFYFRDPLPYVLFTPEKAALFCDQLNPAFTETEKQYRKKALAFLKESIIGNFEETGLRGKIKRYSVGWDQNIQNITGIDTWGKMVFQDILEECENYAEDTWNLVPKDWKDQELLFLDTFIEENSNIFFGRKKLLDEVKDHLIYGSSDKWGLVLTGESGSGKSAVFAKLCRELHAADCFILAHSASISPRATRIGDILEIWTMQLEQFLNATREETENPEQSGSLDAVIFGEPSTMPPSETGKPEAKFAQLIQQVAKQKRIILLLDSIESYENTTRAQYMTWLQDVVPNNIRMMCTALCGTEDKALSHNKWLMTKNIDPFLLEDAADTIFALCKRNHKQISSRITKAILGRNDFNQIPAFSNPLWLSLAINMIMAMDQDDFEKISILEGNQGEVIEEYLLRMIREFPANAGGLFLLLLNKAKLIFGKVYTTTVFDYLACSRYGLREKDLCMVIPNGTGIAWDKLQFASLRRWFRPYIKEQGEELLWTLNHKTVKNAIQIEIPDDMLKSVHKNIASHLLSLSEDDPLRLSETMYHLIKGDDKETAAEYFGSENNNPGIRSSVKTLAEAIISDKEGKTNNSMSWVLDLLSVPGIDDKTTRNIYNNFQILLHRELEIEGCFHEIQLLLEGVMKKQLELCTANSDSYLQISDLAITYSKMGDLFRKKGQSEKALELYEKETLLFKKLTTIDPDNEQLKNELSVSYSKLGKMSSTAGQTDRAFKYYNKALDISEEVYSKDPRNPSFKNQLAIASSTIGSLHQGQGNTGTALAFFEKATVLFEELLDADKNNEQVKTDLAIEYVNQGILFKKAGQFDQALVFFEKYNRLCEQLFEANPGNQKHKYHLATSYGELGGLYQTVEQASVAYDFIEKAVIFFEELYDKNPDNLEIAGDLCVSYEHFGFINQGFGDYKYAETCFLKLEALARTLFQNDPGNQKLKLELAITDSKLGYLYQNMKQYDKAVRYLNMNKKSCEELIIENPEELNIKENMAISYGKLGQLYREMGEIDAAISYTSQSYVLYSLLYKENPDNIVVLEGFAVVNLDIGELNMTKGNKKDAERYLFIAANQIKQLFSLTKIQKYRDWLDNIINKYGIGV